MKRAVILAVTAMCVAIAWASLARAAEEVVRLVLVPVALLEQAAALIEDQRAQIERLERELGLMKVKECI